MQRRAASIQENERRLAKALRLSSKKKERNAMTTQISLGDVTVQRVVEQEGPFFDVFQFFPKLTKELFAEDEAWLKPRYISADNKVNLCIQSYIVRTPHHNILVDTCVGNNKPRPTRPFWHMMSSDRYEKSLAATGLGVGDIDFVMCTHLHTDHVGWNTRLENGQWIPTFPKAKYVFADRELAFWTQRQRDDPAACPWVTDSVLPIVAANKGVFFEIEGHTDATGEPVYNKKLGEERALAVRSYYHLAPFQVLAPYSMRLSSYN
ncbi:MBL fold metallo-hydrolase [bacterium]|nr:MBL fold metallo-hydrolase [bacterium]